MSFSSRSSKLHYRQEQWADVRGEIEEVWKLHNEEIAAPEDRKQLAPDWQRFDELARDGAAHWVTIRHYGRIVGYAFVLVTTHLHRKTTLSGFYDLYWLAPEYRRGWTGVRLLRFCDDTLRARGVTKVYIGTKAWKDIGPILRRLKYKQIETIYSKAL